jgi:ribose/xylose/arabinose/galactoside ABC-type transport system permease subunit
VGDAKVLHDVQKQTVQKETVKNQTGKRTGGWKLRIGIADLGPVVALAILLIVGSVMSPVFMTKENIFNILSQIAKLGLGALGMTYVMISGYLDLSIAGILSLCNVMAVGLERSIGTVPAVLIVLALGTFIGLVNGTLLRLIKGDMGASVMITFGTGTILSALALIYTGGYSIRADDDPLFYWFGNGKISGLPVVVIFFFICAVIFHIVLKYTSFGRSLYLTGANPEAARLSGIATARVRTVAFMLMGAIAAFAAVVVSSQTVSASPVAGANYELDVIAAVVIGGTSLNGGEGSIFRTIIGVLLIGVLSNLFILIGLSTFDQMMAKGLIIIAALIMDKYKHLGMSRG